MRLGEVLGLTWEQIDLSCGVIRLERTKTDRRREIPIRQAVYDLLAAMPEPRAGRVWPVRSIRTAFEGAVAEAKLRGACADAPHDARRKWRIDGAEGVRGRRYAGGVTEVAEKAGAGGES